LSNPLTLVANTWRKNWPEVRCGLTGGLPGFIFAGSPRPCDPGVPVFCYHVVDHDTFREDLVFLTRNGYTTLTADQLLNHIQRRTAAPPGSVVLSFDDGPSNFYDTAFPLLREFNCKAVAFIVPALHREGNEPDDNPAGGLCTWPQILEMHGSGLIDFQPHTDSHRYVPRWPRPLPLAGVDPAIVERRRPKPAPLAEDLRRCKDELERRLNKTVRHLAFPQYNGTDQAIQTARDIGYHGFWWGVLPGRPLNRPAAPGTPDSTDSLSPHGPNGAPGAPADRIVRVSGEFVRRLPGHGRVSLGRLLRSRYISRYTRPGTAG
jgi:peptidoglycan/xylan/chitin deacetylase (PgdA/CDA1 family)